MSTPVVFFDIAGPNSEAQRDFYGAVFGWRTAYDGRFETGVVDPMPALLRTDPPGVTIYLGVPDIRATEELISLHGGRVEASRFEVPGIVVLGIFRDPAGNRLGLVEMDGDRRRIPPEQADEPDKEFM